MNFPSNSNISPSYSSETNFEVPCNFCRIASTSRTYATVYIGLDDISRRCVSAICTACLVVWQPYCLATLLSHRHTDESATGLSLSPHCEHGTGCQQLKLLRLTTSFRHQLETFLFHSACGQRYTD